MLMITDIEKPKSCLDCLFKDNNDFCKLMSEEENNRYDSFPRMFENCKLTDITNFTLTASDNTGFELKHNNGTFVLYSPNGNILCEF